MVSKMAEFDANDANKWFFLDHLIDFGTVMLACFGDIHKLSLKARGGGSQNYVLLPHT